MGNDYWGKRLADKAFDRSSEGMLKELKKIYHNQSKDIQDKVTDLYMKMIEDGGISTTNLYAYGRYTELIREINTVLHGYGEMEVAIVSGGLEAAYKEAFGKTSEALGEPVKWGLQNTYIMEEVVNANLKGANFSKRIWNNRSNLLKTLEKNIQDVVASGQSKDKAIKGIMSIEKASFRNADRLVRTETMRVINDGQKQSFTANGYTHGYYIYSDDDRNCEECQRISKESRKNPLLLDTMEAVHHPNCRCTIRPVVQAKPLNIKNKEITPQKIVAKQPKLQYNNSPVEKQMDKYFNSVDAGMISPLSGYENYKNLYARVEKEIIGITTSSGIKITEQSEHFMERVIGTTSDPTHEYKPRSGVEIDDIKDALVNGKSRPVRMTPDKKTGKESPSKLFYTAKCSVSVNPDTGTLIQCQP